jgi:hypothetical protein
MSFAQRLRARSLSLGKARPVGVLRPERLPRGGGFLIRLRTAFPHLGERLGGLPSASTLGKIEAAAISSNGAERVADRRRFTWPSAVVSSPETEQHRDKNDIPELLRHDWPHQAKCAP